MNDYVLFQTRKEDQKRSRKDGLSKMETNKKTLRIGLLGFGAMGKTHLYAVRNLPFFYGDLSFDAEVVGVCTTSMEKSNRVSAQYHIPFATDDPNALIEREDIDVIDICTPNIFHFDALKKAIALGKHVLCEKPLCISTKEAREIVAMPLREGQICGMVFNNRWLSAVMRAKEIISEGRLGRILSFHAEYLHSSATDTKKNAGWKQDRDVCGGGVLFDLGSHVIDLMSHLCGKIESVSGMSQIAYPTRLGRNGETWTTNADESFYMLCKTQDGACGTMQVGKLQIGTNDELSFAIYGERGALRFALMDPDFLWFYDTAAKEAPLGGDRGFTKIECVGRYPGMTFPSPKASTGWLYGHVSGMHAYLEAVASQTAFHPSLADGAYVQAVMDAAYRSAENDSVMIKTED